MRYSDLRIRKSPLRRIVLGQFLLGLALSCTLNASEPVTVDQPRVLIEAGPSYYDVDRGISLSADGRWLAAAHRAPNFSGPIVVVCRDLAGESEDCVVPVRSEFRTVRLLDSAFSTTGTFLATLDECMRHGQQQSSNLFTTVVRLWTVPSKEMLWEVELDLRPFHNEGSGDHLVFTPDGKHLLVAGRQGGQMAVIFRLDLEAGQNEIILRQPQTLILFPRVTPSGQFLIHSDGFRETVTVRELQSGSRRRTSASIEKTDAPNLRPVAQFRGTGPMVCSLDVSPDGYVAVGGGQKAVNLWQFSLRAHAGRVLNRPLARIRRARQHATNLPVRFSPDGRQLAIAHGDGIDLLATGTQEVLARLTSIPRNTKRDGSGAVSGDLVFTPDGRTLLARNGDGDVLAWDLPESVLLTN